MISNLKIFESNMKHGVMSIDKKYYPSEWTYGQIKSDFESRLINFSKEESFEERKLFSPNDGYYKINNNTGNYINLTNDNVHIFSTNKINSVSSDIIMTNSEVINVALVNSTNDMPVVIMEDTKNYAIALGNCDVDHINSKMPLYMISALNNEYNSNLNDIDVYISSCASNTSFSFKELPFWAYDDKIWNNCIKIDEKNHYHIDLRFAIIKQLIYCGISPKNIKNNLLDTIKNQSLYSNYLYEHNCKNKNGKYLVGAFYEEQKKRIRK